MSTEFLKQYLPCIILLSIGLLCLYITYIGAPAASKKSGKFVSGIPGTGCIFIVLAFLTTPYKWLAFLGLADWQILYIVFKLIPDVILNERKLKNRQFPETICNERIILHTGYRKKYDEINILHDGEKNYQTHQICYYAVSLCSNGYAILSLDVNFEVLKKEVFPTVDECKEHISTKIKWFEFQLA